MSRARTTAVPTLAAAFYLLLLLPPEFSVSLGSMRLSGYRLLLLVMLPVLLQRLLEGRVARAAAPDWLVMGHGVCTGCLRIYGVSETFSVGSIA